MCVDREQLGWFSRGPLGLTGADGAGAVGTGAAGAGAPGAGWRWNRLL